MDKLIKTTEIIEKKLEKFYELHLNCQINLTAVKEREEFYLKHYYDSIYYFQQSESPCGSLADIGSGGGFPGIVLGIFYPDLKVTLIESIGKKCIFLEQAAKILELKNIEVLNTRVENIKDRSFDIITARGVSSVKELLKNSFQISKQNTKWVMYKGERLDEELKEALPVIEKRGLNVEKIRIELPITRTYCIISC
ncbi:16S rRNA (guanine(527)-N(7))-methyltransferase RsmG [Mucispirillum schaedleri]|uniref:16S rRNA (guanine(527)-N(7))-methyltransferase RsmG n=1 Tax=Mucispirillum schaedleri TaxID=248039 RepID=UPI001F5A76DB|nr:16S rRNA (guanine(527)-N(7))-methyltransferase RsmG [Mucispirillum schaedleri]